MIKFRFLQLDANSNLVTSDTDENNQKSMETGFERFLQKTSFDEMPQLLIILIGQMAFIGPRPESKHNEEFFVECRERYTPNAYDVKSGISGYAQTKMKREHDPELKAQCDSEYVKRMSSWFDCSIFVYAILQLFGAIKGR